MNKYAIFDSHAHYDDEKFDQNRNELLKELQENGVIGAVNCSSSYESVGKTCELVNKWDFIYGAVGIHPENANEFILMSDSENATDVSLTAPTNTFSPIVRSGVSDSRNITDCNSKQL